MSQHISTIGLIATEPKLFTPEGGAEFCTFRLASTERRFDAQKKEWFDGETNWFTVNTFRTLAVHANESFSKGDRIIVSGRLRMRAWEKDEKKGTSINIDADGLGHDVRWGVSRFTKKSGQTDQPHEAPSPDGAEEPIGHTPSDTPSSAGAFLSDNFTPKVDADSEAAQRMSATA